MPKPTDILVGNSISDNSSSVVYTSQGRINETQPTINVIRTKNDKHGTKDDVINDSNVGQKVCDTMNTPATRKIQGDINNDVINDIIDDQRVVNETGHTPAPEGQLPPGPVPSRPPREKDATLQAQDTHDIHHVNASDKQKPPETVVGGLLNCYTVVGPPKHQYRTPRQTTDGQFSKKQIQN